MSKKLAATGKSGQARKSNAWGDTRAAAGPAMPFGKPQFLPAKVGPTPRGQTLTSQHYDMASSECESVMKLRIKMPC